MSAHPAQPATPECVAVQVSFFFESPSYCPQSTSHLFLCPSQSKQASAKGILTAQTKSVAPMPAARILAAMAMTLVGRTPSAGPLDTAPSVSALLAGLAMRMTSASSVG